MSLSDTRKVTLRQCQQCFAPYEPAHTQSVQELRQHYEEEIEALNKSWQEERENNAAYVIKIHV